MWARLIIAALVLYGIVMALRWFTRTPATVVARVIRRAAVTLVIVLLLILAGTGRLHWLVALLGAVAAGFARLLPLLRYAPLFKQLWAYLQPHTSGPSGPPSGRRSTVEARFVRMWLDHDTGDMSGEVLQGRFKGKQLHELGLDDLLALLSECRSADQESTDLLIAYLDRVHGDAWREQDNGAGAKPETPAAGANMTREEAYRVLGLESGADEEAIVDAHRRLMQKLHPDRGGSDYLAAKINEAKRVLLGK